MQTASPEPFTCEDVDLQMESVQSAQCQQRSDANPMVLTSGGSREDSDDELQRVEMEADIWWARTYNDDALESDDDDMPSNPPDEEPEFPPGYTPTWMSSHSYYGAEAVGPPHVALTEAPTQSSASAAAPPRPHICQGCGQWPTWDGRPGFCSDYCMRQATVMPVAPGPSAPLPAGVPLCQRCGLRPSYQNKPGGYCGSTCRDAAAAAAPPAQTSAPLCQRCKTRPSYNGELGGYCSKTCRNAARSSRLAEPLLSGGGTYGSILSQFKEKWRPSSWGWGDVPMPTISNIFVLHLPQQRSKFEAKRQEIVSKRPGLQNHGKHAGPGNCQRRFHGTRLKCNFQGTPCHDTECSACMIIKAGRFDKRRNGAYTGKAGSYGDGVYFTSASHTAKGYGLAKGVPHPKDSHSLSGFVSPGAGNCIFVVKVLAGLAETGGTGTLGAQYDSRVVNKTTGNDELVIWDEDQALPTYVITFSGPGVGHSAASTKPSQANMCRRCHQKPTFDGNPGYCSKTCRDASG